MRARDLCSIDSVTTDQGCGQFIVLPLADAVKVRRLISSKIRSCGYSHVVFLPLHLALLSTVLILYIHAGDHSLGHKAAQGQALCIVAHFLNFIRYLRMHAP